MMNQAALAACFAVLSAPAFAVVFDFAPLTVASGTFRATGLNDAGLFVGEFNDGTVEGQFKVPAATYSGGVATRIDVPFNGFSNFYNLYGLNDAGLLVGNQGRRFAGGFAYQDGQVLESGIPFGLSAAATDVNNLGQVAGYLYEFSGRANRGVLVSGGVTTLFDVPGSDATAAAGLNDAAQVVGTYHVPGETGPRGFLLSGGMFTEVAVPGGTDTRPTAINNVGTIAGTYRRGSASYGFLLQGGAYSDITDPSGTAFLPVGLNNAGQVVGTFAGGEPSFVGTPRAEVQPVPEPSSLALLALSLMALTGLVLPKSHAPSS